MYFVLGNIFEDLKINQVYTFSFSNQENAVNVDVLAVHLETHTLRLWMASGLTILVLVSFGTARVRQGTLVYK